MNLVFWVLFLVSVIINVAAVWYSVRSAKILMKFSEDLSYFWLELREYYDHLDRLLDSEVYQDNPEIKRLVEHTKDIRSFFPNFLHICEISGMLSDDEIEIITKESTLEPEEPEDEKEQDSQQSTPTHNLSAQGPQPRPSVPQTEDDSNGEKRVSR